MSLFWFHLTLWIWGGCADVGQVVWAEDRREGRCAGEELTRTKALHHVMVGGLYHKLCPGHLHPLLALSYRSFYDQIDLGVQKVPSISLTDRTES